MKRLVSVLSVILISCLSSASDQNLQRHDPNAFDRQHDFLSDFKIIAVDGKVEISCDASNWCSSKNDSNSDNNLLIKIYRKKIDFIFGIKKKKEFFEGIDCSDTDIIHKANVSSLNFQYADQGVKIGDTYAYWISLGNGKPMGPYPIKVRDAQIWWPQSRISQELYHLQKSYPELIKVTVCGKTRQNKDILGIEVGKAKRKMALVGAIHASESGPEIIIPVIKLFIEEHREIFDKVAIIAIPCVNIDERQAAVQGVPWYLRKNANAVDLNRNFPSDWEKISYTYRVSSADPDSSTYRGPYSASEPETQAVISFIKSHNPIVLFSFHALASVAGRCLLVPGLVKQDEELSTKCREIYVSYCKGYCSNYPDEDASSDWLRYSSYFGTLPLWCYSELGIPAFDVESHKPPILSKSHRDEINAELLERNQKQHAAALLELIKTLK